MFRPPKSVLSYGAVAIATGILMLAAPRAARALAATLVQVTNTAANPAIAQGVEKLASQNVLLVSSAGLVLPHGSVVLQQMFPNGTVDASPFVVPAGQTLVVTTIDLLPIDGISGTDLVGIANTVSGVIREEFAVQCILSTQLQFPNGLGFPAGESVSVDNFGLSTSGMVFTVHGYLTSN